jgi:hypothetical protein
MPKRQAKKTYIKIISIVLLLSILGAGIYTVFAYTAWQNRAIYFPGETMTFSDFTIKILDSRLSDKSGLPRDDILNNTELKEPEDCNKYPNQNIAIRDSSFPVPSPAKYTCQNTNLKIGIYKEYEPANMMLAADLEIRAKKNSSVKVSDITTYIDVSSGRDITKKFEYGESDYTPYGVSSKEGYLHSELSRKLYMWADIRNTEKVIDFVIKYKDEQRIYRFDFR